MTVMAKRQVVLPKALCERKKIREGTALRVTEVGNGIYITPIPEPTEEELAAVFRLVDAGQAPTAPTSADEEMIGEEIKTYRAAKRRLRK